MNAKRCKVLRKTARDFAAFGKLPSRQLLGGQHRFEMREDRGIKKLFFFPSQGQNERMSERGIYRNLKRDYRRTGVMPARSNP
jgi:hypothetical protein